MNGREENDAGNTIPRKVMYGVVFLSAVFLMIFFNVFWDAMGFSIQDTNMTAVSEDYYALLTSGIVFCLLALINLLRVAYEASIKVSGQKVPLWSSIVAFILFALLSLWMFRASVWPYP